MELKKYFDRIQTLYSRGVKSDDSRLSKRHIYNKILTVRARLISQQYRKKQTVAQSNYQTLPCIKLVPVPAHQCPCLPPMGCEMIRSEHKIPGILMGHTSELIQSVTSAEKSMKLDRVSINAINAQRGNKYTSKKVNYFLDNGYLYVVAPYSMGVVSLTGLFDDPIEAEIFKGYCDDCIDCSKCLDYDKIDFPIDSDMIEALIELSIAELIEIFSQMHEDSTNNTRDMPKEGSK